MGIQDRDDDREQYERNAAPFRADVRHFPKQRPVLPIVLLWILIGLALFVAVDRWVSPRLRVDHGSVLRAAPSGPTQALQPVRPPASGIAPTRDAPVDVRGSGTMSAPPSPPIYRCGNAYGTVPCSAGRTVEGPAATGFDSRPSPKLAELVAAGRASEETTTYVNGSTTTTTTRSSGGSPCNGLAAELLGVDADARQPHPASYLDWLRARRQDIRDRQASLHC